MFDTLSEKFGDAFKSMVGKGKITESNIEEALKEIRQALLDADVNFKVVKEFIETVKTEALGEKVIKGVNPQEMFTKILHDQLAKLMGGEYQELDFDQKPLVTLVVGLNGAGKTTFCGKIANYAKTKKDKSPFLVPADTFRPAAKEQLLKHAGNLGVEYFDSDLSLAPEELATAAIAEAKTKNKDFIIIDTAGRLQVDTDLMAQLKRVKEAVVKAGATPEVIMVADAMTGQEAVEIAKEFHAQVALTGIVLSKMDSDARGGAALSIAHSTGVKVRYISTGEKMGDLEPFHAERLAGRILDMGDVVSLVEKAQATIDEKDAEKFMQRLEENKFTMNDFLSQMDQIAKLGSMSSILKMIPGMGKMLRSVGDLSPAEGEMKKMRVMINSMTKKEREDHNLLKNEPSRLERVAKGSGRTLKDLEDFLVKFEQMKEMMINMMGMMKGGVMPQLPGMPAMPGFRSKPAQALGGKKKSKGNKRGSFGKKFF